MGCWGKRWLGNTHTYVVGSGYYTARVKQKFERQTTKLSPCQQIVVQKQLAFLPVEKWQGERERKKGKKIGRKKNFLSVCGEERIESSFCLVMACLLSISLALPSPPHFLRGYKNNVTTLLCGDSLYISEQCFDFNGPQRRAGRFIVSVSIQLQFQFLYIRLGVHLCEIERGRFIKYGRQISCPHEKMAADTQKVLCISHSTFGLMLKNWPLA